MWTTHLFIIVIKKKVSYKQKFESMIKLLKMNDDQTRAALESIAYALYIENEGLDDSKISLLGNAGTVSEYSDTIVN